MLARGEMRVEKNLVIGVGNCVSVKLGRMKMKYREY